MNSFLSIITHSLLGIQLFAPRSMCAYLHFREVLLERLGKAAPGRIQLLTGPRQVDKTTPLLDIAAKFGDQAIYVAGIQRSISVVR